MAADVVVVGGGPAGASCALALARRGVAVTVVERARFPRRKVCGEYLNAGALAVLDELGLGACVRAQSAPIGGIRLVPAGVEPVDLEFAAPARALARATFDALVLDAAQVAGATVATARVEDLVFAEGRVAGIVARDVAGAVKTLRARFVVGADGSGSLVARKLGLVRASRSRRRFALGGHYRGFEGLGDRIEMYVGEGAYFALNPLGEGLTNVMVVVRESELAGWAAAVDRGMQGRAAVLGRGLRSFGAAERVGPRVSTGPLAFDVRGAALPGALLAGDASGFLNPFTGQGVFLALRGGAEAGSTIADALAHPEREPSLLAAYESAVAQRLMARRRMARLVEGLVDVPFLARRAARRLHRLPELGRTLLDALGGATPGDRGLSPLLLGRLVL